MATAAKQSSALDPAEEPGDCHVGSHVLLVVVCPALRTRHADAGASDRVEVPKVVAALDEVGGDRAHCGGELIGYDSTLLDIVEIGQLQVSPEVGRQIGLQVFGQRP